MIRNRLVVLLAAMLVALAPVVVSAAPWKKIKGDLDKAIVKGDNAEAIRIIRTIEDQDDDAIEYLMKRGAVADEPVYNAILDLCSKWNAPGIVTYFKKTITGDRARPDYMERVFITQILERSVIPEATEILVEALKDKVETVQRNAAESLGKRVDPAGVEGLIGMLESLEKDKDTGVLYQTVRESLTAITGEDLNTAQEWRDYWNVKGAGFDPKKDRGGKKGATVVRDGDPEFFETEVISRRLVFIIDTSGTMNLVQKTDIPGLTPTDGSDGLNPTGEPDEPITPENQKLAEYWMRINMVKRELSGVVRALDQRAWFNIYQFNTKVDPWQRKMVRADKAVKMDALKWIDRLKVQGATNAEDALVQAFRDNPQANTFFFLSDGEPDKDGKKPGDPVEPILSMVKKLNRFRKAKVETFGFPGIEGTSFLQQLAAQNNGKFHEILVKD